MCSKTRTIDSILYHTRYWIFSVNRFYSFMVDFAYRRKWFAWFKTQFSLSFTSSADFISSRVRSLRLHPEASFLIPSFVKCTNSLKMMAFISCQLIAIRATATSGTPLLLMHLWRTGMKIVLKCKICGWEIFSKTKNKQNSICLIGFQQLLHVGCGLTFNSLVDFACQISSQNFQWRASHNLLVYQGSLRPLALDFWPNMHKSQWGLPTFSKILSRYIFPFPKITEKLKIMALKCLALIMQLSYDFLPVSDKFLSPFHPEFDYLSRVLGHSKTTSIWKEGIITPNSLFRIMMLFLILFYTMIFHSVCVTN